MSQSPFFRDSRNFSRISRISFLWISSFKEYAVKSSISSSSLHNSDMWSADRFAAFFLRKQSIARFRVIFPRKGDRIVGFRGGIDNAAHFTADGAVDFGATLFLAGGLNYTHGGMVTGGVYKQCCPCKRSCHLRCTCASCSRPRCKSAGRQSQ